MGESLRPGIFLVADPSLTDSFFEETVVLLCAHNEQGSMGLVVNRPIEMVVGQILDEVPAGVREDAPLFWGGPVAIETPHVLHGGPDDLPATLPVLAGVSLGGELHPIAEAAAAGAAARFFLGYAGWDAGQLAGEMTEGTWRAVGANAAHVFAGDAAELWARLLSREDPGLAWMKHRPVDPSIN